MERWRFQSIKDPCWSSKNGASNIRSAVLFLHLFSRKNLISYILEVNDTYDTFSEHKHENLCYVGFGISMR